MRDTLADTGIEPNPDMGPMWVSQDIWVRTSPDLGYVPYPFTDGSPPWTIPAHQNPLYRDPLKGTPNYVYVQVHNNSAAPSTGNERLRLYWAKASTGLSWPTQWQDYQPGGPYTTLYGAEITKPRVNGKGAGAAAQAAYVQAVLAVANSPYVFPPSPGQDFWRTQETIHGGLAFNPPNNIHGSLAFLPWHREFMNRYEILLQQYDPTVKLLYWDWTPDPTVQTNPTDPSTSLLFMGNFSGSQGTPLGYVGAPFMPALTPTEAPLTITRGLGTSAPAEPDSVVLARNPYGPWTTDCQSGPPCAATEPFMAALENFSHNFSHGYIGGVSGNMSYINESAEDPIFFMLHGNVDRLWAEWQRSSSNSQRLDPAQTYAPSLGTDQNLFETLAPWDGSPGPSAGSASSVAVQPWEPTTNGGYYIVAKLPTDPSVVSPPIYDTALLTIPILQPGQAVVIQIPWYPPNPANFASFGSDQGHFCLLARIETMSTPPYGMDYPETSDVNANTRNNNRIIWKNVTVVDDAPGPLIVKSILLRNVFDRPVHASLQVAEVENEHGSFLKQGRIFLDLKPQLFNRWRQGGAAGRGVKAAGGDKPNRIEILSPDALIRNIRLNPGETIPVSTEFSLARDYSPREGLPAQIDLIQLGSPDNPDKVVGGQRFTLDLSKLVLVKSGESWRYLNGGTNPGDAWTSLNYDDSKWELGAAPLGLGNQPATTIYLGPATQGHITTYFRRRFEVADPSFYRNAVLRLARGDGVIVYLNGREIFRAGLPSGPITFDTLSTRKPTALERSSFLPIKFDPANLRPGQNVIATEVHLNSPRYDGMRFDLELLANVSASGFPPDVSFAGPQDGTVFQVGEIVPVQVEALSGDGTIDSVSLYVDGKQVATQREQPYAFRWTAASKGAHRLRVVAVDNRRMQSESFHTISVVGHVPPLVALIEPSTNLVATEGSPLAISAQASVRNGKVARVEFWAQNMVRFVSPSIRIATVATPPYRASIRDLKPGDYMLWAIALDDYGGSTQSIPTHVMITGHEMAR